MITSGGYDKEFQRHAGGVDRFSVKDVAKLPVATTRESAAMWVLNWMAMGRAFQHNVFPDIDDSIARIHTAVGMLTAPTNEMRSWISEGDKAR
ncbi:hypothetical protein PIB30_092066 [Stylosanthes scabra]|uniref:Uncharacterized protein n=1 Tax=Stylosanthes scabra TaxID=79078 RepID=A0ABU6YTR9_9FABA|nr:hypothetical protein [Stylosanthes scabra]